MRLFELVLSERCGEGDSKIFRSMGYNVSLQMHKILLYPECISFHNNSVVASNVTFMTHDSLHSVFNHSPENLHCVENIDCIEVMPELTAQYYWKVFKEKHKE